MPWRLHELPPLEAGRAVTRRGRAHLNRGYIVEGKQMIRKLRSGEYRLYSRKKNPKTGRRRNLGTFSTRKAAEAHERAVQYFKQSH